MAPPERYRQLLDAARMIVSRDGVAALTMSALTKEAGVSRPVVYEHFDNADDVALALLEDYFAAIVTLVDERTRGAETLEDYLERAIAAEFDYHGSDNLMVRNLTNGHATGKRLNEAFLLLRQRTIDTFTELLRQQGASGSAASVGGYALAELVPNVVFEFAARPDADQARDTLVAMVTGALNAILPEAAARPQTPRDVLIASRSVGKDRKRTGGKR